MPSLGLLDERREKRWATRVAPGCVTEELRDKARCLQLSWLDQIDRELIYIEHTLDGARHPVSLAMYHLYSSSVDPLLVVSMVWLYLKFTFTSKSGLGRYSFRFGNAPYLPKTVRLFQQYEPQRSCVFVEWVFAVEGFIDHYASNASITHTQEMGLEAKYPSRCASWYSNSKFSKIEHQ